MIRLGINIDHVATLRNARGGEHPCPVRAALMAQAAGADGITAHLREDRRHISDRDIERLKAEVPLPLNLEMAMTPEMLGIALKVKPHAVCLVPEKREELTTEGGLDARRFERELKPFVQQLQDTGIRVSLFIDPDAEQIEAAGRVGARVVELHTGGYAQMAVGSWQLAEKEGLLPTANCQLLAAAQRAAKLGLEVHAGHGLTYANVGPIAAIPEIVELNIGHFIIGEAVFIGLPEAIRKMLGHMNNSRSSPL